MGSASPTPSRPSCVRAATKCSNTPTRSEANKRRVPAIRETCFTAQTTAPRGRTKIRRVTKLYRRPSKPDHTAYLVYLCRAPLSYQGRRQARIGNAGGTPCYSRSLSHPTKLQLQHFAHDRLRRRRSSTLREQGSRLRSSRPSTSTASIF